MFGVGIWEQGKGGLELVLGMFFENIRRIFVQIKKNEYYKDIDLFFLMINQSYRERFKKG